MKLTAEMKNAMVNAQAIFVNHSGGKDSQAMLAALVREGFKDKCVVVHADLGDMEWEPMHNWIQQNSFGLTVHVVKAEKDFFELCRQYKRLPGGMSRFCTSDLKTKPVADFIRDYCAANNISNAVNCIGIRADESKARAKKSPFKFSEKLSTFGKTVYECYPIFDYKLADVRHEIISAGQTLHHVYDMGFSRLSCVFCVFGRVNEHKQAAKLRPELFKKMAGIERELGKTIRLQQKNKIKSPKYLDTYCG